jgi:hypothetical protein
VMRQCPPWTAGCGTDGPLSATDRIAEDQQCGLGGGTQPLDNR